MFGLSALLALVEVASQPLAAQEQPYLPKVGDDRRPSNLVDGVTVTAPRGQAAMPPERVWDPSDIDRLGADDIASVVERLNASSGGQSPPVIIINGRRSADPEALLGFPPDALARVEILPPAAAGIYGDGDPTRRVVNLVLVPRFKSHDTSQALMRPVQGGYSSSSLEWKRSHIDEAEAGQIRLRAGADSALTAAERPDYSRDHPGSAAISLRPSSRRLAWDFSTTRSLDDWRVGLRAGLQAQESAWTSRRIDSFIRSRSQITGGDFKASLSGSILTWSMRSALSGSLMRTSSRGGDANISSSRRISLDVAFSKNVTATRAGPVSLDLSGQAYRSEVTSRADRRPRTPPGHGELIGLDLSVPLTRSDDPLQLSLGSSSVKLGLGRRTTDAGGGGTANLGAYWSPVRFLSLNTAWFRTSETATDAQRLAPRTTGPTTIIYDFRTGRSVQVETILGGNPALGVARRDLFTTSFSAGPFSLWRLSLNGNYRAGRQSNEIGWLPLPTPEIEAAFPGRYQRNLDGRLIAVDQRPIAFRASNARSIAATASIALPEGVWPLRRNDTLQATLSFLRRLEDSTQISAGLARMDRLEGDAGGVSREELTLSLEGSRGPANLGVSARHADGYRIRQSSGLNRPEDLRMTAITTVDLRFRYRLDGVLMARAATAPTRRNRGLTISASLENLFDDRPRAILGDGRTAPGYGRDDRDPIGRAWRIALSQQF